MTPQQIANRVSQEADARFDEVIERLLFILEHRPQTLVKKWGQTGLLLGLPDFVQETLAEWLEEEVFKIIDAKALGEDIDEDIVNTRLHAVRQRAVKEYEAIVEAVKQGREEHYISLSWGEQKTHLL
jgi:hypothetical protein